jgi:nicotinamidase-related amidase
MGIPRPRGEGRQIGDSAVHLCLDMQRLLAPEGPWPVPWAEPALHNIIRIADRHPARTVFTRFVPPTTAEQMPGAWREYYEKWRHVTREFIDPALLDLLPPLTAFVPPAHVIDKTRYSAFFGSPLLTTLNTLHCNTVVVTGAETDICVLSTALTAVDLGFAVIIVEDAICSSSDRCHDALLTLYRERLSQQVEIVSTDTLLERWKM